MIYWNEQTHKQLKLSEQLLKKEKLMKAVLLALTVMS
jgi:hypothetical protein